MDSTDLLDYALGRLEGPRLEQFERRMARDPEFAERVSRLMRNLSRLLDDGREPPPLNETVSSESSADLPPSRDPEPPTCSEESDGLPF